MSKNQPNFLTICVDQMQAACMACAGHPEVKTPNLDKLAGEGVRFSRAYCENPVCTPSRLSIFTGLSSRQHGVYCNGQLLPPDIPTVASVLRNAGYRTKACGKMHVHPWSCDANKQKYSLSGPKKVLQDQLHSWEDQDLWRKGDISAIPEGFFGFESVDFVGGHVGYIFGDYLNWLQREHPKWGEKLSDTSWRQDPSQYQASYFKNENALTPGGIANSWRMDIPPELHHNNWIADCTIAYLDEVENNENFFLWCSFPDPHHPFAACKPYSEMYDPKKVTLPENWENAFTQSDLPMSSHGIRLDQFNEAGLREMIAQTYGMITHIDDNIGRIVQVLKDNGQYENTVIVFMADHGDYLGAHHLICKGVYPFEELIRVPYIWRSPSTNSKGRPIDAPVSLLDFAPTILDYAGIPLEELTPRLDYNRNCNVPWFNGVSLRESIEKDENPDKRSLIITKEESRVNGQEDGNEVRGRCFIRDPYKMVIYARGSGNALFNLENDPYEQNNLWNAPEAQAIRHELLTAFAQQSIWTEYVGVGRIGGA